MLLKVTSGLVRNLKIYLPMNDIMRVVRMMLEYEKLILLYLIEKQRNVTGYNSHIKFSQIPPGQ